jgi:hypothetical protein
MVLEERTLPQTEVSSFSLSLILIKEAENHEGIRVGGEMEV